ncbi:MAG TPA: L,D-transpeptidase [Ktedonobacterales bacterium]
MMEPQRESSQGGDASMQDNSQQLGNGALARRRNHTVRNLLVASLLVCVALIGVSSVLVTGTVGALRGSWGGLPGVGVQQNIGDAGPLGAAAAAPKQASCDCQGSQVSQVSNSISGVGKEILVNLTKQHLYAYQDGQVQFDFLIASGRPELPTPVGRWTVLFKKTNFVFTSPWPPGSPFYYYPTHINYALNFHDGGFYLHDSWWRCLYGPGANLPHQVNCTDEGDPAAGRPPEPVKGWEYGSHGCVGMTTTLAAKLYNWAPIGTTVLITR